MALMILGVLPCMTLGLIIGGIAIERESPGHGGTVMIGSSALPAFFMFMSIRGWFSIHVDAEALSIVGFLGLWRARMPWKDLEAVGLVPAQVGMSREMHKETLKSKAGNPKRLNVPVLAVRPVRPYSKAPWWALRWDNEHRLLCIAGLDNWSASRQQIIRDLRRLAGPAWREELHI
ncbi:hypothetical protein Acsp03_31590 [Actinomadura sp. NBRC 104412]|uniref:hypothetical protein n=1 Tax=Actinomadura sp. NBRC 104412 TaxID=3032203 RepID=UPI0024A041E6|nr:hypothetical protein [Actinomadura sp. NBRC 104412]GLZ05693.1 hypothetical protein Acsp03_31590 [Actinomadura sp. NBRC 104412]